VNSRISSNLLA